MRTPQLTAALAAFEVERPNLRDAFEFCLERPDVVNGNAALRLASAFQVYFVTRGWHEEAVLQLNAALAHLGSANWSDNRMLAAQHLIFIRSNRMNQYQDLDRLASDMEDNLPQCSIAVRVDALCSLGIYYMMTHAYEKSILALSESERLAANLNDHRLFTRIYTSLAELNLARYTSAADDEGNVLVHAELMHLLEIAREHAQQTENIVMIALAFTNEGSHAIKQGRLQQGFVALRNGLKLAYKYSLTLQTAWAFGEFRAYSLRVGEFAAAIRFLTYEGQYRHDNNFIQGFSSISRLEECYQALGEVAYQREVEIASSWSLEQAVEYALALPPPLPDSMN
jgi:hypothetical protein